MEAKLDINNIDIPIQEEQHGCYTSDDSSFETFERDDILL